MSLGLEWKKIKRTGFLPGFLAGGIVAAAVPVLNMAFRSERYLGLGESPVKILLDANWQMMAMLNLLLWVLGGCILYHTEYADNAIQRMCTLPLKESRLFFGKFALLGVMCAAVLAIEAVGIGFCACYWFGMTEEAGTALLGCFGYALVLSLPTGAAALLIASLCKNMWISLGIGVICVFTATMLPTGNFGWALFPFALPFQTVTGASEAAILIIAAVAESGALTAAELVILRVRRSFT